ncbi:unnamed protein product, partial [Tenebrio molitor]
RRQFICRLISGSFRNSSQSRCKGENGHAIFVNGCSVIEDVCEFSKFEKGLTTLGKLDSISKLSCESGTSSSLSTSLYLY